MKRKIYADPKDLPTDPTGLNELQVAALEERQELQALIVKYNLPIERLRVTDPRYNDSQGRYHPLDAFFWSAGTPSVGEIKKRTYKSTDCVDWAIHSSKLEAINRWVRNICPKEHRASCNILLIYSFADGVTAIWNLRTAVPTRREQTKNKWFNLDADGNRIDKVKDITYYSLADATILRAC